MERVVLLGGSGFIGSNLAMRLVRSGVGAVVADPFPPKYLPDAADSAKFVYRPVNLSDEAAVESVLGEYPADAVVNLASSLLPGSTAEEFYRDIETNFLPGLKLYELLKKHSVKKVVFFSTGGAIYGKNEISESSESDATAPLSYYGWMKKVQEEYLALQSRMNGFEYLILRPSNPYGRFQNVRGRQGLVSVVFGKILAGEPLEIWGDGSVVRDYIYADDLSDAAVRLLLSGKWNDTYNIGSGKGASVNEIIELARTITGLPLKVDYKQGRPVDSRYAVLDVSKLKSAIDFEPVDLAEGMKRYWNLLKEDAR